MNQRKKTLQTQTHASNNLNMSPWIVDKDNSNNRIWTQHVEPAIANQQRNVNTTAQVGQSSASNLNQHRAEGSETFNRQQQFGLAGGHRIRHWPLRFSGAPNGLDIDDFLFRVERQAELAGVSHAALVIGIDDLLTDRSAQWNWTNQRKGETLNWTQLRQAFLRRYATRRDSDYEIRSKIENRKQRQGESFGDFCQDVEALSVRMARRMPVDELVEVLRRNMNIQLRKALWRQATDTVEDLLILCDEFKELCASEDQLIHRQLQRRSMRVAEIDDTISVEANDQTSVDQNQSGGQYQVPNIQVEALHPGISKNDNVICWNCKDIGHTFTQCSLPKQSIFCYSCGMTGVLRTQCTNLRCVSGGNGRKDVMTAGPTHPTQQGLQILRRAQNPQSISAIL